MSCDIGERRFEVVGMFVADTFEGIGTASASGARRFEDESGKMNVARA